MSIYRWDQIASDPVAQHEAQAQGLGQTPSLTEILLLRNTESEWPQGWMASRLIHLMDESIHGNGHRGPEFFSRDENVVRLKMKWLAQFASELTRSGIRNTCGFESRELPLAAPHSLLPREREVFWPWLFWLFFLSFPPVNTGRSG